MSYLFQAPAGYTYAGSKLDPSATRLTQTKGRDEDRFTKNNKKTNPFEQEQVPEGFSFVMGHLVESAEREAKRRQAEEDKRKDDEIQKARTEFAAEQKAKTDKQQSDTNTSIAARRRRFGATSYLGTLGNGLGS